MTTKKQDCAKFISVADYGAYGDGKNDDSIAIKKAVSVVADSGGGIVFFPAGTYRTSTWIDIDKSNIRLLGAGRTASIIKPLNKANVGGIRVGAYSSANPVSHVTIESLGYHGNDTCQAPDAKQLHGISLLHCSRITIRDCFLTRTAPYHEHNTGGSGISVELGCSYYLIEGCWIDDIGDRCIQTGGSHGIVRSNFLTNGFDRAVSFNMRSSEEARGEQTANRWHLANDLLIEGNIIDAFSNTSCFGGSSPKNCVGLPVVNGNTSIRILGNYCRNVTRTLMRMARLTSRDGDFMISNNFIEDDHDGILFAAVEQGYRGTIIVDNNVSIGANPEHTTYQPTYGAINISGESIGCTAIITNNVIKNCNTAFGVIAVSCSSTIANNEIKDGMIKNGIIMFPGSEGSVVENNSFLNNRTFKKVTDKPNSLMSVKANNIVVRNNRINQTPKTKDKNSFLHGIIIEGDHCIVSNNDIQGAVQNALTVTGSRCRITLNNLGFGKGEQINLAGSHNLVNWQGEESAGIGNPPAVSNWPVGAMVRNRDDDSIWIKDQSSTMRRLNV